MKVVKWKIWYDNRKPFSSDDGSPEKAPLDGILVVVQMRENGIRQILQTSDYYFFDGKEWRSGQIQDLEKWLRKELPGVKYGRQTDDETWQKAKEEALSWE